MEKAYVPHPVDTSDVTVNDEILALAEKLAENTHEVWARGRMAEGWVYGEKTDPDRKTHCMLVPYSQLTESEKDYDRRTSLETLKVLLKLGFSIEKKD